MHSGLRWLASGLVLSLLFVASVYSQGTQTGGITGVVSDWRRSHKGCCGRSNR